MSGTEPSRPADRADENLACVISFDGNPYDKVAPTEFAVLKGSWRWDIRTDTTLWSEQLYRIIGRESTRIPPFREHFRFYTSESWIRLVDATLELLKTGTPYELRLQMLHNDGSRRWVICEGEPVGNDLGEIVEVRGTVQDITEWESAAGEAEPNSRTESNAEEATRRLVQAQEEENARLVIKFRDNICKRLALLAATIESFRSAFPVVPQQSDMQIKPLTQETGGTPADVHLPTPAPTIAAEFND